MKKITLTTIFVMSILAVTASRAEECMAFPENGNYCAVEKLAAEACATRECQAHTSGTLDRFAQTTPKVKNRAIQVLFESGSKPVESSTKESTR